MQTCGRAQKACLGDMDKRRKKEDKSKKGTDRHVDKKQEDSKTFHNHTHEKASSHSSLKRLGIFSLVSRLMRSIKAHTHVHKWFEPRDSCTISSAAPLSREPADYKMCSCLLPISLGTSTMKLVLLVRPLSHSFETIRLRSPRDKTLPNHLTREALQQHTSLAWMGGYRVFLALFFLLDPSV